MAFNDFGLVLSDHNVYKLIEISCIFKTYLSDYKPIQPTLASKFQFYCKLLSMLKVPQTLFRTFLQNFHFGRENSFIRPKAELESNCKCLIIKIYLKQSLILELSGKCFQTSREIVQNSLEIAWDLRIIARHLRGISQYMYITKYYNILINSLMFIILLMVQITLPFPTICWGI